ncbi:unnamed protein product [Ambrosiozyma monospora]|uniref:Unnamed protein product n=1 Tax=Ambrosiozyma monospora TaxID=43982 RepID=A0ACB5SZ11_AMBMO|nr:unnamed protein product [Ambrosiozyma monospora]
MIHTRTSCLNGSGASAATEEITFFSDKPLNETGNSLHRTISKKANSTATTTQTSAGEETGIEKQRLPLRQISVDDTVELEVGYDPPVEVPSNAEYAGVNPYSTSLWYYLKGENGAKEIENIRQRTLNKRNLEIQVDSKIIDMYKYDEESGSPAKRVCSPVVASKGMLKDFEIPENSNPPSALTTPQEPYYSPHGSFGKFLNKEKEYLEFLKQYELLIQSFRSFLKASSITMKNVDIDILFGNYKNMISIIELFFSKISQQHSSKSERNAVIYDYTNRLGFVYVSAIEAIPKRRQILDVIWSDKVFEDWKDLTVFKNQFIVDDIIWNHIHNLHLMLKNINPVEFHQAITKLESLTEHSKQLQDLSKISSSESPIVYINISLEWRKQNKHKWRI